MLRAMSNDQLHRVMRLIFLLENERARHSLYSYTFYLILEIENTVHTKMDTTINRELMIFMMDCREKRSRKSNEMNEKISISGE